MHAVTSFHNLLGDLTEVCDWHSRRIHKIKRGTEVSRFLLLQALLLHLYHTVVEGRRG